MEDLDVVDQLQALRGARVIALLLLAAVLAAALHDVLAIEWYDALARGSVARGAALAMSLEALNWLPVVLAISTGDLIYMIAAVAGSGAGNVLGIRRARARKLRGVPPVA